MKFLSVEIIVHSTDTECTVTDTECTVTDTECTVTDTECTVKNSMVTSFRRYDELAQIVLGPQLSSQIPC